MCNHGHVKCSMPCILIVFLGTIFRFLRQNRYWNCSFSTGIVHYMFYWCFFFSFRSLLFFIQIFLISSCPSYGLVVGCRPDKKKSIGKIRKIVVWIVAGVLFDSSLGVLLNAHDDNITLCSQYLICFRNYWRFSCATSTWLILWCKLSMFETGCTLKTRS